MLRIKFAKLRQVCVTAFVPTILKGTKNIKNDFNKCAIERLAKAGKSTDTGPKDENYGKRRHIVDQCFPEDTSVLNTEPLSKDNIKHHKATVEDKNKSFVSQIIGKDKHDDALRNAQVQAIASKVEEVKLAHDILPYGKIQPAEIVEDKLRLRLPQNPGSATIENVSDEKIQPQDIVQIDKTPRIEIEEAKEAAGASKVSALLQNINVQTATGRDEENIGNTANIQNVEISESSKVSDALEKAVVIGDKIETPELDNEKLYQHVVQVDKSLLVDVTKEDVFTSKKIMGTLQESNVQATTAKIEEEKLTQRIDNIDETAHVEASVDKIEGFNVSPRVLGNDTPELTVKERNSDTFSDQIEQVNLDELAKKCLGKPDGDIDNILLKEIKNLSRAQAIKLELPKDDSSQKYFSQIFENKSKDNNNIVFDITNAHLEQVLRKGLKHMTDKEMRVDNFHPFHLDTVPIITTDTGDCEEYKRKFTSDDHKNLLLDIPAVLDPYDMQAIPFYQYVTKENVFLKELQPYSQQKHSPAKTIQETEVNAPMNEEVILKRDEEAPVNELKELEEAETDENRTAVANSVEPLPEVDPHSSSTEAPALLESDVSKLLEYKHVLSAQQDALTRMSPNIIPSQCPADKTDGNTLSTEKGDLEEYPLETAEHTVLTTPTPPTDPFGNPDDMQAEQSKTGETYRERQSEAPASTAISANQDPNEYFPTNHLTYSGMSDIQHVEYVVSDTCVTYTGVFDTKAAGGDTTHDTAKDTLISHSAFYYSTFPQLAELEYDATRPVRKSKQSLDVDDHIPQALFEPKQEYCRESLIPKESFQESFVQSQPTREYIREELAPPEPQREYFFKDHTASEPRRQNFRDNFIEPRTTGEEIEQRLSQPEGNRLENMKASITKDADDIHISEGAVPLSVLLRRVRERNRLELIRSIQTELDAKKSNCFPPLDKTKPKTTLSPAPCKPKPKECEPKCPSPCKPPEKKDPCAKFLPIFLATTLRSSYDVSIPPNTIYADVYAYLALFKKMAVQKLKYLIKVFGFMNVKHFGGELNVVGARDFEPWVPIPSWPIPKIEKKRPVVFPKDGCKLPVRPIRSNTDKPCLGIPKKMSPN